MAVAAGGWAARASAQQQAATEPAGGRGLIDTHVYLGRWPFCPLPAETPEELVELLRQNNVTQAWAGTFEGLLHKDVSAANERLARWCRRAGQGMLLPFGTINPRLPEWEEDVRRCGELFEMPGIRLHPNYHGYELDDPQFARLLELAAGHKLLVQVVVGIDEQRRPFLSMPSKRVSLRPLIETAGVAGERPILIHSGLAIEDRDALALLASVENLYFDCLVAASMADADVAAAASRIVFGSCGPRYDFENAETACEDLALAGDALAQVRYANAQCLTSGY